MIYIYHIIYIFDETSYPYIQKGLMNEASQASFQP